MAFEHKHLIDINEYSDTDIMTILETAKTLSEINQRKIKKVPTLKGLTVVNMFNEPSTRTRLSFTAAMLELGGQVIGFSDANSSSVSKGEFLKSLIVFAITGVVGIAGILINNKFTAAQEKKLAEKAAENQNAKDNDK